MLYCGKTVAFDWEERAAISEFLLGQREAPNENRTLQCVIPWMSLENSGPSLFQTQVMSFVFHAHMVAIDITAQGYICREERHEESHRQ